MRLPAFAIALLLTASLARGFGGEGHQIVALIAEPRLTPATTAAIHDLLGADVDISDAEVANWADEIKRDRRDTAPWHYVNIPIAAVGFDAKRDKGPNIITAIAEQAAILADKSKPKDERAEALKFVTHLIGDLHQPLHAGDRDDRGGNTLLVFMPDSRAQKATNLHSVWDTAMLRKWLGRMPVIEYAAAITAPLKPEQLDAMAVGTPITWANESHDVARDKVYPGVPAGKVTRLDRAYVDAARPVIDQQLVRAGVRLAAVLNAALK